jgi:hypothetical protein
MFLMQNRWRIYISVSTLNVDRWNQDTVVSKWKFKPEEDKNNKMWVGKIDTYAIGPAQKWASH